MGNSLPFLRWEKKHNMHSDWTSKKNKKKKTHTTNQPEGLFFSSVISVLQNMLYESIYMASICGDKYFVLVTL